MQKLSLLQLLVIGCLSLASCNKDDSFACGAKVLISPTEYEALEATRKPISGLKINGDCLQVEFSVGGCEDSWWHLMLVDSGEVTAAPVPERKLIFSLSTDNNGCRKARAAEMRFDLSALRVDGNRVLLYFPDSNKKMLYEY